jgi:hypothetical protein
MAATDMSVTVHRCRTTKFTTLLHYNVIKNNENRATFIPEDFPVNSMLKWGG